MKRSEVIELIAVVSALWPNADTGDPEVALSTWARILADIDAGAATAAVEAIASEGDRFAPPVGAIRKRSVELAARASGGGVPDVDEAWEMTMRLIREKGFYGGQPSDLPEPVASVVAALGWSRLCHDESPAPLFAQFRDLYRSAGARTATRAALPPSATDALAHLGRVTPALPYEQSEIAAQVAIERGARR